jgi:hypothetical protein
METRRFRGFVFIVWIVFFRDGSFLRPRRLCVWWVVEKKPTKVERKHRSEGWGSPVDETECDRPAVQHSGRK